MLLRGMAYSRGWKVRHTVSLPVVVVGNLSVGGTGKTPLTAALVTRFQAAGWRPAIVSRGYGGMRRELPHLLDSEDTPETVGDEPMMLFQQLKVPVCVCINRAAAVNHIARHTSANLVFSDDGLQHLAMPRAAQIMVIDGERGFGNGWLLPAGPLRDSPRRLAEMDLIAIQTAQASSTLPASLTLLLNSIRPGNNAESASSNTFALQPETVKNIVSGVATDLAGFKEKTVHAVAGIGNPQRFFGSLESAGFTVLEHAFPDHHEFTIADVTFADAAPILVTSKDAVKLRTVPNLPDTVFEVQARVKPSAELDAAITQLEATLRARFI